MLIQYYLYFVFFSNNVKEIKRRAIDGDDKYIMIYSMYIILIHPEDIQKTDINDITEHEHAID